MHRAAWLFPSRARPRAPVRARAREHLTRA